MDTKSLAEPVSDPLAVSVDRLYRISPKVYQGMIEHGLLTDRDKVAFADGLLVHEQAGGKEADLTGRLYHMPLDVYDGIADIGLLGPGDKVELVDGLLVKKMAKGDPHTAVTVLVQEALRGILPPGWLVKKEDPIALPSGPKGHASEPEPDVAVVRGGIRDYLARKPRPEDLTLVVEVAERSLREDRTKLTRYAWAGIPVAWLVNLKDRTVKVHSGPAGAAGYRDVEVYGEGDEIPVTAGGREAAREILP